MTTTYDTKNPEKPTILKSPGAAALDYPFNWTSWLALVGDTISSHLVTVPTGLTLGATSSDGQKVVVWLSGGTAGQTYRVKCQITTNGGRTDTRSIYVKIKER